MPLILIVGLVFLVIGMNAWAKMLNGAVGPLQRLDAWLKEKSKTLR